MTNRCRFLTAGAAVVAAVVMLTACGEKPGPAATAPSTATPKPSAADSVPLETTMPEDKETVIESFVEQAKSDRPADELMETLAESVTAAGPAGDDAMLRAMDEYYSRNLPQEDEKYQDDGVQKVLLEVLKFPFTAEQADGIPDEEVRKLVKGSLAGGYTLDTAEGFWYPIVDYTALNKLADSASPAMKEYLALMARESGQAMAKDAALVISRDELLQRTLAAESFAVTRKEAPEREKVKTMYVNYLRAFLLGLDNTPTTDDFKLQPDVKTEMEQLVREHPDTMTAAMTQKFLDILKQTGDMVFSREGEAYQNPIPEVQAFIDGLEQEALKALG